jgi:hypothetical protein
MFILSGLVAAGLFFRSMPSDVWQTGGSVDANGRITENQLMKRWGSETN